MVGYFRALKIPFHHPISFWNPTIISRKSGRSRKIPGISWDFRLLVSALRYQSWFGLSFCNTLRIFLGFGSESVSLSVSWVLPLSMVSFCKRLGKHRFSNRCGILSNEPSSEPEWEPRSSGGENENTYLHHSNTVDRICRVLDSRVITRYSDSRIKLQKNITYKIMIIETDFVNCLWV